MFKAILKGVDSSIVGNPEKVYTRPQAAVSMLTNAEYPFCYDNTRYNVSMNYWGSPHRAKDEIVIKLLDMDYRVGIDGLLAVEVDEEVVIKISSELNALLGSSRKLEKYKVGSKVSKTLTVIRHEENRNTREVLLKSRKGRVYRITSSPESQTGKLEILKDEVWHILGTTGTTFNIKRLGNSNAFSKNLFHYDFFEECIKYIEIVYS